MRFQYWVIRYVPDAVREEFVNIGVVAGKGDDWQMLRVNHLGRASRLGGSAVSTTQFLDRVERSIAAELDRVQHELDVWPNSSFGAGMLEDLRARMNNVVQLSHPRTVLAETADDAAALAFELMVVDAPHQVRHRERTKALHRLRTAFTSDSGLERHLALSRTAVSGEQRTGIDVAVRDGEVRQLTQVWAFDLVDMRNVEKNIQAWSFLMGILRDDGGRLVNRRNAASREELRIPPSVEINAVFTEPRSEQGAHQLEVAVDGWKRLGITAIPAAESDSVVARARALISA